MKTLKVVNKERDYDQVGGSNASQKGEYLTTKEVAEIYPIYGFNTLKDLRYKGVSPFPYYRIGRKILYKRSDIEFSINSRKVGANV